MYYQQSHQGNTQNIGQKEVMDKVGQALAVTAAIVLAGVFLPNLLFLLTPVAFIAEIVSIIAYFFVRSESTLEIFYNIFVASSSILIGALVVFVGYTDGFVVVGYAMGLTVLIYAFIYNQAQKNQPDVGALGRLILPLGIIFLVAILLSIFFFPEFLNSFLFAFLGAALFSLYLYYDLARVLQGHYSSPTRMAWQIYWDIILVFKYVLRMFTSDR